MGGLENRGAMRLLVIDLPKRETPLLRMPLMLRLSLVVEPFYFDSESTHIKSIFTLDLFETLRHTSRFLIQLSNQL